MTKNISYITYLCCLVAQLFVALAANSAERPEVHVAPPEKWIEPISFAGIELKEPSLIRGGKYYLLYDVQTNDLKQKKRYKHYAIKLLNENAVEENSRISINFAPSYQSLILHNVIIWRNGKAIQQAIKNNIQLLQREKELENLTYDGRWTASLLLKDVRKGDILEYSYTIRGQNPAFGEHYNELAYLQWNIPIGKQVYRLLWPKTRPLFITTVPKKLKAEIKATIRNGHKEYRITRTYFSPRQVDGDAPEWYSPWERVSFSSFASWQGVANWALGQYRLSPTVDDAIERIAAKIRKQYHTKLEQASAALHYVQDEIRYVGIEIGAGSYIPTQPVITLRHRYGDCKDKTYFLLTLLNALGVEAHPALANTESGESINEDGPRITAFNHVLVQAVVDGKQYWLETTINNQAGPLDKIYQPDYGDALVLKPGSKALVSMRTPQPYHKTVYNEVFDLTAGINKQALYSITSIHIGRSAEDFRSKYNANGKTAIAKQYLDYYRSHYKHIDSIHEMTVADNEKLNKITTIEKYRIEDMWQNNKKRKRNYAKFHADNIASYMVKPKIVKRDSPYETSFPLNIEQNITVLLPEDWSIKNEKVVHKTPFFDFSQTINYDAKAHKLVLGYKLRALKKYIEPGEVDQFDKAVDDIDDELYYNIYNSYASAPAASAATSVWLKPHTIILAMAAAFVLLVAYSYVEFLLNQKKAPSAEGVKYFPVATSKFYILSLATFGLYLLYWNYKNWAYVKKRDHSTIIPWGRSLFYNLWYYALYRSLSRDDAFRDERFTWKMNLAYALLATAFLVLMIFSSGEHVINYLAAALGFACVLPLAEKINHLTPRDNEYYRFNSQWRPRHFIFIAMFVAYVSFETLTGMNIIPSSHVTQGKSLWDRDVIYMQRIGVLQPQDKLLLFYSDAYFSYKEDGNGLTNTGVFSYWRDQETGKLNTEVASFNDIADIKYSPDKFSTSTIQIYRKNGTNFVLYVKNSKKLNLYKLLKQMWAERKAEQSKKI